MSKKETVDILVEGGKATPAPPLGSALGPLKVNVAQIVKDINDKTKEFQGMKVPVKVVVDTETKAYTITVGTPPVSQLIKKELNLKTMSGEPNKVKYGVLAFEQALKIAKMKKDSFLGNSLKADIKTVLGSCQSSGILIDGKDAKEILKEIDAGKYDDLIKKGSTEVSKEKQKELDEVKKKIEIEVKKSVKAREDAKAAAEAKAASKKAAAEATPATTKAPAAKAKK